MAIDFLRLPDSVDEVALNALFQRADEIGLRLEMTESGFTWEAWPGQRHQEILMEVVMSIQSKEGRPGGCQCHRVQDVAIRFPDGLVKRPDISIFCARPPEDEGFIHQVPEAVVEITSPGYETKDLVDGPSIYLRNGVRDVLTLDRRTGVVHHWTRTQYRTFPSPTELVLESSCRLTV